MTTNRKIRVLIAKPGLDGHDRGAKVLTLALREKGMEVIYSGLRKSPQEIVQRALKEKVDVIGLSLLSGAQRTLFPEVVQLARENDMNKVLIIGGGSIPEEDIPILQKAGIKALFGPGTPIEKIADYIRNNVKL